MLAISMVHNPVLLQHLSVASLICSSSSSTEHSYVWDVSNYSRTDRNGSTTKEKSERTALAIKWSWIIKGLLSCKTWTKNRMLIRDLPWLKKIDKVLSSSSQFKGKFFSPHPRLQKESCGTLLCSLRQLDQGKELKSPKNSVENSNWHWCFWTSFLLTQRFTSSIGYRNIQLLNQSSFRCFL